MSSSLPPEWYQIPPAVRKAARMWIRREDKKGRPPSVARLRTELKCQTKTAALICRLYKSEQLPSTKSGRWDVGLRGGTANLAGSGRPAKKGAKAQAEDSIEADPERIALAQLVRDAKTDEDRERAMHELGALVAMGLIGAAEAKVIQSTIAEARQSAKAQREAPTEDPERMILMTREAVDLVRLFDRLVSDDRRAALLAAAESLMAEDLEALPSVDPIGAL